MRMPYGKIIQIIPAPPGLMARYEDDDSPGGYFDEPVACLALEEYTPSGPIDDGEKETFIVAYVLGDGAALDRADFGNNLAGLVWKEEV